MKLTKNSQFAIFTLLLLALSSLNAFAVLEAVSVIAGSTTQDTNNIIDLHPGDWATFNWHDTDNNTIIDVNFSYEDPNITNDDKDFMNASHYEDPYQQTHNNKAWFVPSNLAGTIINVTISDINDANNKHTISCRVLSAKTHTNFELEAPKVTCFPNPVVNTFNIKAGSKLLKNIDLYDLKGNLILRREFNQSYQETIDITTLPKGTYVAIINKKEQFRIVKN